MSAASRSVAVCKTQISFFFFPWSVFFWWQRNARRLDFIGDGDSIQRLQLANADGSEPEELDVDATLEDVIICMGNKQLVAIVNSSAQSPSTECNGRPPDTEKLGPASPMALAASLHKPKAKNDTSTPPPSSYAGGLATTLAAAGLTEDYTTESPGAAGLKPLPVLLKNHRSVHYNQRCDPTLRGLKITIPSSDPSPASFHDSERCAFTSQSDYACERQLGGQIPPMASRSNNCNGGGIVLHCAKGMHGGGGSMFNPGPTPSPAELAQFLVRGSALPHRISSGGGGSMNGPIMPLCNRSTPNVGFQSFASALMSQLPVMPNSHMQCPAGTPNIAMLAQFLASQLRAFVPVTEGTHPSAASAPISPKDSKVVAPSNEVHPTAKQPPPPQTAGHDNCPATSLPGLGSPKLAAVTMKLSISESHDKDQSSSSANVNAAAAPSSDGIDSEQINGCSDLIFLVNRRSKTVDTRHLISLLSEILFSFHQYLPSVQRFDFCIWKQWPVNRMLRITWWIISWFVTSDCFTRFSFLSPSSEPLQQICVSQSCKHGNCRALGHIIWKWLICLHIFILALLMLPRSLEFLKQHWKKHVGSLVSSAGLAARYNDLGRGGGVWNEPSKS